VILALLASAAQAADLLLFATVTTRYGIGAEVNPIMRDLYLTFGIAGPALCKGGTLFLSLLAVWAVQGTGAYWIANLVLVLLFVVGFVGAASAVPYLR
jgi:hypothetical protein